MRYLAILVCCMQLIQPNVFITNVKKACPSEPNLLQQRILWPGKAQGSLQYQREVILISMSVTPYRGIVGEALVQFPHPLHLLPLDTKHPQRHAPCSRLLLLLLVLLLHSSTHLSCRHKLNMGTSGKVDRPCHAPKWMCHSQHPGNRIVALSSNRVCHAHQLGYHIHQPTCHTHQWVDHNLQETCHNQRGNHALQRVCHTHLACHIPQ